MTRRAWLHAFVMTGLLAVTAPAGAQPRLTVSVASSLADVMGQVVSAWRARGGGEVAISLVDHEQVGHFYDTSLDALQFVACAGQQQQQKKINHGIHCHFRLAYANGFHQNEVEPGCFAKENGFPGHLRDSSERISRGGGPHIGIIGGCKARHPGFIPKDASASQAT